MADKLPVLAREEIENQIFTLRGVQVMLDKDLATFYDVKPIRLREQVKRNNDRFPEDFIFQLAEKEVMSMVSQNAIPSKQYLGGHLPYVFTEQGVAALSAVLKSERAVQVSIQIIRAFVAMRKLISTNAQVFQRLESKEQQPEKGIFFEGQIFDAYVFVADLIKIAENSIILIDNYIDETVLLLLTKRKTTTTATVYTKQIGKELQLDLKKHNEQYPAVEIKILAESHDRFLIIDEKYLYHIGASLKDLGKKWFAFSKMDSLTTEILNKLK
jgi:ORF6N domain